jgi:hypothetical protein
MKRAGLHLASLGGPLLALTIGALLLYAPYLSVETPAAAPVALFLDAFHERFFWPALVYLPAAGLALAALRCRLYLPSATVPASQGNP